MTLVAAVSRKHNATAVFTFLKSTLQHGWDSMLLFCAQHSLISSREAGDFLLKRPLSACS